MPKQQPQLEKKDYERIGRTLESIVQYGYADRTRLFVANFFRGVFFGLGSALGATILITLLLFVLSLFSEVPLVGELFEKIQNTIEKRQ